MLREITDQKEWDALVEDNTSTDFLQTWGWGEVKKVEGWEPIRLVLEVDGKPIVAAQVLIKEVKFFGKLAYIPHGPFAVNGEELVEFVSRNAEIWKEFEDEIIKTLRNVRPRRTSLGLEKVFAIEIEPKIKIEDKGEVLGMLPNWLSSGRNVQPIYKLTIDLEKSEEEILAAMKKNTRYNIRYAAKNGVIVNKYFPDHPEIKAKLDKFYELLLETQQRAKGYPIRSKKYFDGLFEIFRDSKNLVLFEAVHEGKTLAMNVSEFTNVWASSFYAGSSREDSQTKATYLLRWESILEAKSRGCKIYDFWGIVPDSAQHKGYSDNKLSFGGDRFDLIGLLEYKMGIKSVIWRKYNQLGKMYAKVKYR